MTRTATPLALPPPPTKIHFIGIGGVSMRGLAELFLDRGYRVSGSDAIESDNVRALRDRGVNVVIGHADPTLAAAAALVVSTRRAEMQAGVEIQAALARRTPCVKRGQLLDLLAAELTTIAVAGTHGKSTTSGMVTVGLDNLGESPTYALGAVVTQLGHSTASGTGRFMTIEADEFDRTFLWLHPNIAIVTSVSFDHPDIYESQADYDAAFVRFASQVSSGGTLVIAADDPGCARVLAALRASDGSAPAIVTFGERNAADWQLLDGESTSTWRVRGPGGEQYDFRPTVTGRHNARNSLAAIAALVASGFDPAEAISAVERFAGVGRRFEHKGTHNGIDIVDDYAHHPEEITAVLAAARERFPDRRLIAVHQPHTFSRTKLMLREFASSLDATDAVVLLDVYPSGETDSLGITSEDLRNLITVPCEVMTGPEDAARFVASMVQPGDIVMTLGAGDITRTGELLLATLVAPKGAATAAGRARAQRAAPDGIALPDRPGVIIQRKAAMSMYSTMRVGGLADFLVRAAHPDDMIAAVRWAREEGLPVTIIGGGSNLLIGDGGIRGLVIVSRTPGQRARDLLTARDHGDRVHVSVAAQAPLSWVGRHCCEQGWAGLDWGVGLPGQIGGATVNNAGAHGTELKDHLIGLDLLLEDSRIEHVPGSWLQATYRMTVVKGEPRPRPWIVLRTHFMLQKHDRAALVALADDHAAFRKRTQPTGACSGSTFANPPGDFAGRLLEVAGLKGYRIGGMQFSTKHANWVVNTGNGTAREAWSLIQHARSMVEQRFGLTLRPEIERVGDHQT